MTEQGKNLVKAASAYVFGEYTLDLVRGALLKDGAEIKLRPQSYEVLVYLLQRPGKLVSRDELVRAIWGQTVVTDDSVTHCVIDIRKAIGDKSQKVIRTIPKRGYIFDLDVAIQGEGHAGDQLSGEAPDTRTGDMGLRRLAPALVVLLLAAAAWWQADRFASRPIESGNDIGGPAANTIAVLPFVDMSTEQDQGYFAEGVSEEVIHLLAQTPDLLVIARTSSFSFGENTPDIATVAKALNVAHVLEGSVRKTEDQVRVTAQLVDAATSAHVWSHVYERDLGDMMKIQTDIARSVAAQLQATLTAGGTRLVGMSHDPKAYESYLRANFFFNRRAPGDVARARDYYQQAIDLDPGFARAWAGLAGAYWVLTAGEGEIPFEQGMKMLRQAADRSLALDPDLVEGHLRARAYWWATGDDEAARRHLDAALAIDPNNELLLGILAGNYAWDGDMQQAVELQRKLVRRDPLAATHRHNLASYLLTAGRLEEASSEYTRALELNPSESYELEFSAIAILQGRLDEALFMVESWPEGPDRQQALSMIHQALGRDAEAAAEFEKLTRHPDAVTAVRLAEICAYRGDVDGAFEWLSTVVGPAYRSEERSSPGMQALDRIRQSAFLFALRDDPRWNTLPAEPRRS